MFVQLDESLKLGLDCVAITGPGRAVAYGWAITPRGAATELVASAGLDGDCAVEYCSFHPRPELAPTDARGVVVSGFTLVLSTPEEPRELALTLTADARTLRADLFDPRIDGNLGKATAERSWRLAFGLLQESAGNAALAGLLRHGGRPFGAFDDWIGRLPLLRGQGTKHGRFVEVEAVSTAAGEVLVMLRAATALPPEARLQAAVVCWLRGAAEAPPEPVLVLPADRHVARLPAALAFYARLEPGLLDRLQATEVILLAEPQPGEETWLRCLPAPGTVPDLLDAAGRTVAADLSLPVEAPATAGLGLLREVTARREAAFAPALAALSPRPAARDGARGLPRLALVLGADDPAAGRLFHVTADAFERHCDTVLVMGAAADDVAEALARRGRLRVLAGMAAAQALREAAGRAGIVAIEAAGWAEAVIAGTTDAAFATPLEAAEVARLLALHAAAGCAPSLADSLQRLLRARRDPAARFTPVQRAWRNRHAAELANAHLQRLWQAGGAGAAMLPEPALNG